MAGEAAVAQLEEKLQESGGGVAPQHAFRLLDSLPVGVPTTCYDEVSEWCPKAPLVGSLSRGRHLAAAEAAQLLGSPQYPTCSSQVEAELYLGPHGQRHEMMNKDGLRLQTYFWPAAPSSAKAIVLFCHGHGAHLMFEICKATVRIGARD